MSRVRVSLAAPNFDSKMNKLYEAAVAQLVEHHVAKSEVNATTFVDESSLVSRSKILLKVQAL